MSDHPEHHFSIEVAEVNVMEPAAIDALIEHCGDVLIGVSEGQQFVEIARRAATSEQAAAAATEDVARALPSARIVATHVIAVPGGGN